MSGGGGGGDATGVAAGNDRGEGGGLGTMGPQHKIEEARLPVRVY